MYKRLEWFVARRYLSSRRKGRFLSLITLIAVGGIFLGVTALITVIAVMTGLQRDLQAKILGTNPHIYLFQAGQGFRFGDWRTVLSRVQTMPDVTAAEPFIMTQVFVTVNGAYSQPGTLYGIDPAIASRPMTTIEEQVRSGELAFGPTQSGLPGLLIGRGLAEKLTVLPGDTVVIGAFENIKTGPTGELLPKLRQYEITGIFRTGMYEYDNQNMYARIPDTQELLDLPADTVSGIAINIRDPWQADRVSDAIFFELGHEYFVDNWMKLNYSLFSALKLEKLAMGVILFLIVLVAAFNIISTLIMVVTDKTREIGILKSMGMTDRGVLRIFIAQGLTIGIIGTALGALGGLVLVQLLDRYKFIDLPADVYFIDTLPVALDGLDFAVIIAVSVLIAFAATIYPARQASRLQPVDAIRHD